MIVIEANGKKKPTDISLWAVSIGRVNPFAVGEIRNSQEEVLGFIKKQHGFAAVRPVPGRGTLLLFFTEDDAKKTRVALEERGCPVGNKITECYVPGKYFSQMQQ